MAIKNSSFRDAVRDYCVAVLGVVSKQSSQMGGPPLAPRQRFTIEAFNRYSMRFVQEIEWFAMHDIIERALNGENVETHLLQTIQADPRIARHFDTLIGTSEGSTIFDFPMFLRSMNILLWENQQLGSKQRHNLNEAAFNTMYEQIENSFYSDLFTFRCFAPVERFQMEEERIELDTNFSITRFPDKDRQHILEASALFGQSNRRTVANENIFEAFVEVPKLLGAINTTPSESGPNKMARQQFDAACEALRLFQQGAVGFNDIWLQNTTWVLDTGTHIRGRSEPILFRGTPYFLTSAEKLQFERFWINYRQAKQVGRASLNLALRRFEIGYQRSMPEDKLIDYMIAFEALLLGKDVQQELSYRLSLRGATLLGSTPEDRKIIFEQLNLGYKERSKIVHGGSTKDTVKVAGAELTFGDFVVTIEDRLRSTIKEFLSRANKQSEAQMLKELDKIILTGP